MTHLGIRVGDTSLSIFSLMQMQMVTYRHISRYVYIHLEYTNVFLCSASRESLEAMIS